MARASHVNPRRRRQRARLLAAASCALAVGAGALAPSAALADDFGDRPNRSWGQVKEETAYCAEGWRIERDAGTSNPRYNYIGEGMSSVRGTAFGDGRQSGSGFGSTLGDNSFISDPSRRKIVMTYYNVASDLKSHAGRTRYFCRPD